jgi:membrane protease YdiL (CAAX protease family)
MADNHCLLSLYGKSPIYQLYVSLLIVLGVGILLFSVFLLVGNLIFDTDLGSLDISSSEAGIKDVGFLRYVLISQHISLFIVPAIIILTKLNSGRKLKLKDIKPPRLNEIILVIVLSVCIFPINNFAGTINSGMHFPDWLSGVEKWMIEKEDNASRLIDILMMSNTFWAIIFNVFMIAVIPAIGEELIFRGVFQKILNNLFKSGHLAIWITAFVFSALHFQFFGFIPRFILGLVFGYLFFWGGTLWLPVISHFVNNAVPVIGAYIQGSENISSTLDIPFWKQIAGLPLPLIISLTVLLYFRNKSKKDAGTA